MITTTKKSSCCLPTADRRAGSRTETATVAPDPVCSIGASTEGMIFIEGGGYQVGSEGPEIWAADGEAPVRKVSVSGFWVDEAAVTNAAFAGFVGATGFVTEAERFGWSFVHYSQIPKSRRGKLADRRVAGLEWWYGVEGAWWREPLGDGRDFDQLQRGTHPAVHISWNDASAYAEWAGKRLPTDAEWEVAARGGLEGKLYPWGDDLQPGGKHRCNIWQGKFPTLDTGEDGYRGTAPARSFKPNGYGLFNMTGNVWEWVNDWFHPAYFQSAPPANPRGPQSGDRRIMRGGSYLCHASYCNRYRCSARTSNTPDTSSGHLGFRCALTAGGRAAD